MAVPKKSHVPDTLFAPDVFFRELNFGKTNVGLFRWCCNLDNNNGLHLRKSDYVCEHP